jgi:hypothetical protein
MISLQANIYSGEDEEVKTLEYSMIVLFVPKLSKLAVT